MAQSSNARSLYEDIIARGTEAIDENDWAAAAQKRVAEGSDGLWLRLGPHPRDGGWTGHFLGIRMNPCVSVFATIFLFGMVGFCAIRPGNFCTGTKMQYSWSTYGGAQASGTVIPANLAEQAPYVSLPSAGAGSLTFEGMDHQSFANMLTLTDLNTTDPSQVTYLSDGMDATCSAGGGTGLSTRYPCVCGSSTCTYLQTCNSATSQCTASTDVAQLAGDVTTHFPKLAAMASATRLEGTDGNIQVFMADGAIVKVDTSGGNHKIMSESVTRDGMSITVPAIYSLTSKTVVTEEDCFMPKREFDTWMAWVTEVFTWFYIVTQDVWMVFLIWLAFSRFGKVKIGRDSDEPEFSYFAWFAMLFTSGVATGLFYFAVSEPQYYYLGPKIFAGSPSAGVTDNPGYYERNRWTYKGVTATGEPVYNTINDRVQNAITTTWYHWGLHGWICYCIFGILIGFLHFRKGLPLTMKSCFYPIMGERIYGFCGDFLDSFSVVATTMGVCTSLGLGVMQINAGIEMLNGDRLWLGEPFYNKYNYNDWSSQVGDLKTYWDAWPANIKDGLPWYTKGEVNINSAAAVAKMVAQNNQQMTLIWLVTALATTSVMLGLNFGIKQLALTCMALGQFTIFYVLVMDDTYFLANLFVQSLGHYISELPHLGFYASAVEQSEVNNAYGEYSTWQFWWTIFYWGWWIAWAPLVGTFLARICRGRTVREFIFCAIFASCAYNFIFLEILGGAGLKMQLLAEKFGIGNGGCDMSSAPFAVGANGEQLDYKVHPFKANVCRPIKSNGPDKEMFCSTVVNLACSMSVEGATHPLFHVLSQYADAGVFMVIFVIITLTLYFVASSDSGSMVDDMLAANGMPEPCLAQRLYWALTEGAAASALLSVGKYVGTIDGSLKALRAASICVGLPYSFMICAMQLALYRSLQYETGEKQWGADFKTSVLDFGVTFYKCGAGSNRIFNGEKGSLDFARIKSVAKAFVAPPLALHSVATKVEERKNPGGPKRTRKIHVALASVCFYLWFLLLFVDFAPVGEMPVEWGSVMGNASAIDGNTRYFTSKRYGYYHLWANQGSERKPGQEVTFNMDYEKQGGGLPVDASGAAGAGMYGVGDRMAKSRRISAFGWFFFFCFTTYICGLRNEVRDIYKVSGGLTEDFFATLIWPTAILQLDNKLDEEPTKGKGWEC